MSAEDEEVIVSMAAMLTGRKYMSDLLTKLLDSVTPQKREELAMKAIESGLERLSAFDYSDAAKRVIVEAARKHAETNALIIEEEMKKAFERELPKAIERAVQEATRVAQERAKRAIERGY